VATKPVLARVIVTVALMTGSAEAGTDPTRTAFFDGNRLLDLCTSLNPADADGCPAFVAGVADTMSAIQETGGSVFGWRACIPKDVIVGQAKDIAVRFLRTHPEMRHYAAAKLLAMALGEAFPCSADQTK
jgi:hypothetical protein